MASAALLATTLGSGGVHAADVAVTQLAPFQWFNGEYTSDASGVSQGWAGGRNPSGPPVYTVEPTTGVIKLVGGMRAYSAYTSINDGSLRSAAVSSVGLYSKDPTVGLYERIALTPGSQLYGRVPGTPVRNSAGYLYGVMTGTDSTTALNHGNIVGNGLVFKADPDATHLESVASTVGKMYEPNGALAIAKDDTVYGVDKGPQGNGRIFRIAADGTLSSFHEFSAGPSGQTQVANGLIMGSDGWLYGVTGYVRGLPFAADTPTATTTPTGTLYRMNPADASTLQVLHTFTLAEGEINVRSNIGQPYGLVRPAGTYEQGPTENVSAGTDNQDLSWVVDGGDGWMYGNLSIATCMVQTDGYTNAYHPSFTPLCGHTHSPTIAFGGHPYPYYDGPHPYGVIYRMRADGTGAIQLLHVFNDTDGATPRGRLAVGKDGNIYGTTVAGGANRHWIIKEQELREAAFGVNAGAIRTDSQVTCAELFSGTAASTVAFRVECEGNPDKYLLGDVSEGTLFRIVKANIQTSDDGTVTNGGFESLHSFKADVDGFSPLGVQAGDDGHLYGTTLLGGNDPFLANTVGNVGVGAVFQVDLDGNTPGGSVSIAMTPSEIQVGEQAALTWTTNQAGNCVASSSGNDFTGAQPTQGAVTLSPAMGTYRYTLSCTDSVKGNIITGSTALYVGTVAEVNDGITQKSGNGGGAMGLLLAPLALGGLWARRRRNTR